MAAPLKPYGKPPPLDIDEHVRGGIEAVVISSKQRAALRPRYIQVDVCKKKSSGKTAEHDRGWKKKKRLESKTSTTKSSGCWNCGAESRHSKSECPAKHKACSKCSKIGHYATVCHCKPKADSIKTVRPSEVGAVTVAELVTIVVRPKDGSSESLSYPTLVESWMSSRVRRTTASSTTRLRPAAAPVTAIGSLIHNDGTFIASLNWDTGDSKKGPVEVQLHILQELSRPSYQK